MQLDQGLIHYYYGNGKGKTSTLIGSLIRAHGHGLKVILIQFLKLHDEKIVLKDILWVRFTF